MRRILADQISAGHLRPGQRLGAERALATELGVSRAALRQALAVLEEGGLVRRVPGRGGGTFVSKGKIERDLSRVVGVPALLRSQGVVAGTRVLSARLAPGDETAARALRLRPGELVIDLVRIRLADGSPFSVEHLMLPADRFPGCWRCRSAGRCTSCSTSATAPGPRKPWSASRWSARPPTRR